VSASPEFDAWARQYDDALAAGLSITGEGRDYYALGRVTFLADRLRRLAFAPRRVLDFGCGTGATARHLLEELGSEAVIGLDVSQASIACARDSQRDGRMAFEILDLDRPAEGIDLAYTNGVFHHIAPGDRPEVVRFLKKSLRPGGILAFWENNPWNPGTRYVMSRIPFDRDAAPLSAGDARNLLRGEGFEVLSTDYLFLFPRALRWLRSFERPLSSWPLGAQYQILCRATDR